MPVRMNNLGGPSHVLSDARELAELGPCQRALLPDETVALFRGFPESVEALADRCEVPALAEALRGQARAGAGCALEIHEAGPDVPPEVVTPEILLRFGRGGPLGDGVRFTMRAEPVPPRCPEALRHVLELLGRQRVEFGLAEGFLATSRWRSVARLDRALRRTWPDHDLALPEDPDTWVAFHERSGTYVCAHEDGRTFAFSPIAGELGPGPSIDAWLEGWALGLARGR